LPVPPSPVGAPPPALVEVVPGVDVVVAGVLGVVGAVVVVLVGVDSVEVVVVEVDVEVVRGCVTVGVIEVTGPVVTPLQSLLASALTVLAPRLRSETSVGSTDPGRLAISVSTFPINVSALAQ
jgi:hypothetical protein